MLVRLLYVAAAAARDGTPAPCWRGDGLLLGWGWSPFCTQQGSCARGELCPAAEAGHCLLSLDRKRQLQNPAATQEQPCQLLVISHVFWPTEPTLSSAALMPQRVNATKDFLVASPALEEHKRFGAVRSQLPG